MPRRELRVRIGSAHLEGDALPGHGTTLLSVVLGGALDGEDARGFERVGGVDAVGFGVHNRRVKRGHKAQPAVVGVALELDCNLGGGAREAENIVGVAVHLGDVDVAVEMGENVEEDVGELHQELVGRAIKLDDDESRIDLVAHVLLERFEDRAVDVARVGDVGVAVAADDVEEHDEVRAH